MKRTVVGPQVVEWVANRTGEHGSFGAAVGFGIERDGELIAGVVFNEFNGVNINMHVASDGSGHWLTRKFLWMVFDYAFNQAKVNRITGLVGEGNTAARKFDENIGFELEARLKGAHPTGDMFVYWMTRDKCRWLALKDKVSR